VSVSASVTFAGEVVQLLAATIERIEDVIDGRFSRQSTRGGGRGRGGLLCRGLCRRCRRLLLRGCTTR
jgi:hypothetical protein